MVSAFWLGGDHGSSPIIGPLAMAIGIYAYAMPAAAVIHFLTLALFLTSVTAPAEAGLRFRSLLSAAAHSGDCETALGVIQFLMGLGVLSMVVVGGTALRLPLIATLVLALAIPVGGWLAIKHRKAVAEWWHRVRREPNYRRKTVAWAVGAPAVMAVMAILYLGLFTLLVWLVDHAGARWGRAIAVVLLALIAGAAVWIPLHFIRTMFRSRLSPYPPGKFTPEQLCKKVATANPNKQQEILYRTNHHSLRLTPEGYIEFLRTIQRYIDQEPALSTYWAQRAEIEQALKQERHA